MKESVKKRVLLTDDDSRMRDELTSILEDEGFEVYPAGDGNEAYREIMQRKFDLLILDLKMPVMDGYELLEKMENGKIRIKTIVLTGNLLDQPDTASSRPVNDRKSRLLGRAEKIMTKPCHIPELIHSAKSITGGRHGN